MPDPPKHKPKPIPIPVVLLKCPEIQSFPSLLSTQAAHGGIRVPVPMNEFVDCVKFVHEVKGVNSDTNLLDVSSAGGSMRGAPRKWVPKGAKDAKDPVLEAAERLLEKVSEATTKAPVGDYEQVNGRSEKEDRATEINTTLIREFETIKASVTRIVDQMDKKLDSSLSLIRDTIADTAVETVTNYLEGGMGETREAMATAIRDMMKEEKNAAAIVNLPEEFHAVPSLVAEMSVTVKGLEAELGDVGSDVKKMRSEIADMRAKLAEQVPSKAPDVAPTPARPDSQLVVLKNQVGRTLDSIGRVELHLIDVQKKISDLPAPKSSKSVDTDKIIDAIQSIKDRMLKKQEQALAILKNLAADDKAQKKIVAADDKAAGMTAELGEKLSSLEDLVKTRAAAVEAHFNKELESTQKRLLSNLAVIKAQVHPDSLPSMSKIEHVVRAHVNVLLDQMKIIPSNNDASVKAFQSAVLGSTNKIYQLQETTSKSSVARFDDIKTAVDALQRRLNLLPDKDLAALESRIAAIEQGVLSDKQASRPQTRSSSRAAESRPQVSLQSSTTGPVELFQIDVLIRNHVGRGLEDLKKWLLSVHLPQPAFMPPESGPPLSLAHFDRSMTDLKAFFAANTTRTQVGDGRMIQYAATDITKLAESMKEVSTGADLDTKFNRLDGRLTFMEKQLCRLDPLAASVEQISALRSWNVETIVRPLLLPLRKLELLDKMESLLEDSRTKQTTEMSKLNEAQMIKLGEVLQKLEPINALNDIKLNFGSHFHSQLRKLDQLDHLGAPNGNDINPDIVNRLSEKMGKILSAVQGVDKRVYNTEVRLYDLKPPILSAVSKLEGVEQLKTTVASIEKHVVSLRLAPELDMESLQLSVVAPLQASLDAKIAQALGDNKSETGRFHSSVLTILKAVKELTTPLPTINDQLNLIKTQLEGVMKHARSSERDAAVRAEQLKSLELLLKTIVTAQDLTSNLRGQMDDLSASVREIKSGHTSQASSVCATNWAPNESASDTTSTYTLAPSSAASAEGDTTVIPNTPTPVHPLGSFADRFLAYRSHPSASSVSTRTTVPDSPPSPIQPSDASP